MRDPNKSKNQKQRPILLSTPKRLRPARGTCPGCGVTETEYCLRGCLLLDNHDLR